MFALLAQAGDKGEVVEKAADAVKAAATTAPQAASGWLIFSLLLAIVFLPYILGSFIANGLKLKDFSNRIGTVLFMLAACLTPVAYRLATADPDKSRDVEMVSQEVVGDVPVVFTITDDTVEIDDEDRTVDTVEFKVQLPALYEKLEDDELVETTLDFKVELQSDGGGYNVIKSPSITGKKEDEYEESFRFPLTGSAPWDVRVTRVTEDSSSAALANSFSVATYTKIVSKTFSEKFAECFRLGIDLAGGTNLVYQIDKEEAEKKAASSGDSSIFMSDSLDNMVGAIARRINPSGLEEVTVRKVGEERIEIIIPGADQAYVEEMKDRITRLGTLEFEILATMSKRPHHEMIRAGNLLADEFDSVVIGAVEVARWVDIVPTEHLGNGGEVLPAEFREVTRGEETVQQALVALSAKEDEVSGEFLIRARETPDPTSGRFVVSFQFDSEGGNRMRELTTEYRPIEGEGKHRLAILLDGKLQTAPSLRTTIEDRGQIEGNFTRKEIRELVDVLNAGALDVPLDPTPISEFTISPLLGQDVRKKGVTAIIISAIVVVIAMACYYLKAGLIAVLCLALNLLLIMGAMIFVQGTFTLPGLAGLVLTIGMAVDANVLIFERIREEINRGASIRMAIHNGFSKAFSAIIDSNVTTLIVAIVLFMIGTDQVKGFAVTLFIGILMSMFSALYFGRLVFELLEQKRMLTSLKMFSIVKSSNWDFVGKRNVAFVVSAAVILIGMAAFIRRGDENLDIDFRGGTMVTFEFTQPQKLDDFKEGLKTEFGGAITVERLTAKDESRSSDSGIRWRLRTANSGENERTVKEVQDGIAAAIDTSLLKKVELSHSEITQIPAAEVIEGEPAAASTETGFEGGWTTTLTFTDDVTTNTASRSLVDEITAVGQYGQAENLFRLVGTKGEGTDVAEGQVQKFTELKLDARPALSREHLEAALASIESKMSSTPYFEEVQKFSTAVGSEMQWDAILAMFISLIAIVAYIWLRFRRATFGIAAVAALVHDVLVVLGVVALASMMSGNSFGQLLGFYDFKINLPMIAAFLTIVGYSLNDTIVIFDRIREVRGKNPLLTTEMINTSLNQTLARTLMTSATTFLVVAILYVFGGEGIHGFAFCLLVGVIVGTYSSIYVASPVLLWLMNRTDGAPKTGTT
jgi:SecD/SecF fusion protein